MATSSDERTDAPTLDDSILSAVAASSESNDAINKLLKDMQTWEATLPFVGIEGREDDTPIDLFQFTNKFDSSIIFDRDLYPPDVNGRVKLMAELKRIAFLNGSNLVVASKKYTLHCSRCRVYASHDAKKNNDDNSNSIDAGMFDAYGVLLDMRKRTWRNDRKNNRADGQGRTKASKTTLPKMKEHRCKVCLLIELKKDEYYYLRTNKGMSTHTFHTKPSVGAPGCLLTRHLGKETKKLVASSGRARTGVPKSRYITFEHCDDMVSASTARSLALVPTFLRKGQKRVEGSANDMLAWLRKNALDHNIGLGYCVLNHTKEHGEGIHRPPKGRPSKKNPTMSIKEVNETMTYNDVPGGRFETIGHYTNDVDVPDNSRPKSGPASNEDASIPNADVAGGLLNSNSNPVSVVHLSRTEDSQIMEEEDILEGDTLEDDEDILNEYNNDSSIPEANLLTNADLEGETGALTILADLAREVLEEKHQKELKVLLGAAWVDTDGWLLFQRFPEVIYMDTTFSSCNESRPLLLVCGRDSNGKGFVIARCYMPNETKSFFMWVLLRAFPYLLGKRRLSAVNLLLTDGDSQEYESVDSARHRFFTKAFRGRCCRHAVFKTYEKDVGSDKNMEDGVGEGPKWGSLIRQWVYTLCDGTGAASKEEFDLSKDMLHNLLNTNEELKKAVGDYFLNRIKKWLGKVLEYEDFIAFYKKKRVRAFNEYMTNVVEGMNYAAKKSDISAKPNMSMSTAADCMMKHSTLKAHDRNHHLGNDLVSTPLYVQPDGPHNVDCLSILVSIARHLIIAEFKSKFGYSYCTVTYFYV